jgi:hypothetical protein
MMLMYWPALNEICCPCGSLSMTRITSWVSFSIFTTRAVYSRMATYRGRLVFDFDVAQRGGAAEQHLACREFLGGQRARLVQAGIDLAGEHRAFALAAAAVAAFVGQVDVLAQAGIEQGFVEADGDGLVVGMEGDHRLRPWPRPCAWAAARARNSSSDRPIMPNQR